MNIKNGYILSVTADSMTPEILNAIKSAPTTPEGYGCRLRADTLEWELYELPPLPEDEELSAEEALAIITGGNA